MIMTTKTKKTQTPDSGNINLFPAVESAHTFVIACPPSEFKASRIAQAVEDCEARLINMNVTDLGGNASPVIVQLRTMGASHFDIARSLERYGFFVEGEDDDSSTADTFRDRVNEVLLYLNIK